MTVTCAGGSSPVTPCSLDTETNIPANLYPLMTPVPDEKIHPVLFGFRWVGILYLPHTPRRPSISRYAGPRPLKAQQILDRILVEETSAPNKNSNPELVFSGALLVYFQTATCGREYYLVLHVVFQCRLHLALIVAVVVQLSWNRVEAGSMWPKIHFTAHSPTDKSLALNQKLVFQTVVTNDGQGYDNNTGIFTCPFSGLYIFSLQHCVDRNKHSYVSILVAGVAFGSQWYPCSSMQAFVSLKKGEKVWSKANVPSYIYYNSDRWTTLSGVLLRPDALSTVHMLTSFET
ncbi:hypothetical protein MAR_036379, partial [Mya arenaria]